ncbi:hypothetical protein AOQ84DRAFT_161714 [Glonium stellatum]|uniref:Uncharacterized protein n=1 Tax=Glonium stellatum TaxID=574774 RepID=A0A8E2F7V1_9PEZI|nr:hypothetical protein AOQ84DRAFT_161714 [Glonium stellatum]
MIQQQLQKRRTGPNPDLLLQRHPGFQAPPQRRNRSMDITTHSRQPSHERATQPPTIRHSLQHRIPKHPNPNPQLRQPRIPLLHPPHRHQQLRPPDRNQRAAECRAGLDQGVRVWWVRGVLVLDWVVSWVVRWRGRRRRVCRRACQGMSRRLRE